MSEQYIVDPSNNISGTISVPGDKSISHRSLILLSISSGEAKISGLLESDDCLATLKIFKTLGVSITKNIDGSYYINGKGAYGLKEASSDLNCGNSGTSMRLLSGLMCGQKFSSRLIGDSSLSSRPMKRISSPLGMMGANIKLSKNDTAPINIIMAAEPVAYKKYSRSLFRESCISSLPLMTGLFLLLLAGSRCLLGSL